MHITPPVGLVISGMDYVDLAEAAASLHWDELATALLELAQASFDIQWPRSHPDELIDA